MTSIFACSALAIMCALFAAAAVFFYMRYERVAKSAAAVREALARSEEGRSAATDRMNALAHESDERLREKMRAETELAAAKQKIEIMQARLSETAGFLDEKIEAQNSLTIARQDIKNLTERLAERENAEIEMRKKLASEFETLSSKLLEEARVKMSASNLEQLSLVLKPMKVTISDFRDRIEALNELNIKGHAGLEKHIESLVEMNSRLSNDARNLAEALRGKNKITGNWGESVFHRILESCGFAEGVHFRSQASYADSSGAQKRLVPDFVIDLPEGRSIVVDSKVSLVSYSDYCSSETADLKKANLEKFKKSVRAHLKEFSSKYNDLPDARCGFKMMFMPIEPAYELAVSADPSLLEDAYAANVLIVGPATVMSVLKYAEILVRNEAISKNTRQIADLGVKLYERVNLFMSRFESLGDRIAALSKDYAQTKTTLSESPKSVLATAKRLGVKTGALSLNIEESEDKQDGK